MFRMSSYDRYQNDPIFSRIVDVLYMMLETDSEYGGRQFTPTEMREAAMLACEKYEYKYLRPTFLVKQSVLDLAMFGGTTEPSKTATGARVDAEANAKTHR